MRRVALLLLVFVCCTMPVYAEKKPVLPIAPNAKPIDIVYVHGAYDDLDSFEKAVRGVHDDMIKHFQSDPLMYKKLLDSGNKKIGAKEVIYFWGGQSQENLRNLDKALEYAKSVSSLFAQFGRSMLAHLLHDAIWVSKPANSKVLLDNLNNIVKSEHAQGKQVILYGYSAGSLITYDYLSKRLPIFNLKKLTNNPKYTNPLLLPILKKREYKPTCLEALTQSEVMYYTSDEKFVLNPNEEFLVKNFERLDEFTDTYCSPEGAVVGVVLFGTPLITFESDNTKQGSLGNEVSQYMFKYIIEHDMFLLSVNYTQDFIAVPMPNKLDVAMLDKSLILSSTVANGGFTYDNSSIKYRVNTLQGHSAYWENGRKFAKSIVESYNDGFEYFYNPPSQVELKK